MLVCRILILLLEFEDLLVLLLLLLLELGDVVFLLEFFVVFLLGFFVIFLLWFFFVFPFGLSSLHLV